mmetsp:Transcript_9998/g.43544  ORF Transcript_9998/g.43544 Transcript_9998/m.43544 type:complete len:217 (+) Transcript_9998:568-1218(+)
MRRRGDWARVGWQRRGKTATGGPTANDDGGWKVSVAGPARPSGRMRGVRKAAKGAAMEATASVGSAPRLARLPWIRPSSRTPGPRPTRWTGGTRSRSRTSPTIRPKERRPTSPWHPSMSSLTRTKNSTAPKSCDGTCPTSGSGVGGFRSERRRRSGAVGRVRRSDAGGSSARWPGCSARTTRMARRRRRLGRRRGRLSSRRWCWWLSVSYWTRRCS